MKNKRQMQMQIVCMSVLACGLHAAMLHTQFNQYFYTSVLKTILFALCPVVFHRISPAGRLQGLLFNNGDRQRLRQSLALGLFVFLFAFAAFAVLRPLLDPAMVVGALSDVGITGSSYPYVFLYVLLVNAAMEELFFRGFVFLNLFRMGFKRFAHVFSSLLFALYHVSVLKSGAAPGVLLLGIGGLVAAGLVFNELARRCDGIAGSLPVHAGANLAINMIGAYYLYVQP